MITIALMNFEDITFRPIQPQDEDFLCKIYTSTRWEEMSASGWNENQIRYFLKEQFTYQHKYYQENYAAAQFSIICSNGKDIGRLYRENLADEIRIIDIALLPEFRNYGIGTRLLTDLLKEAAGDALAVRIHVEKNNPAMRLYDRLGFKPVKDVGVYWLMECWPEKQSLVALPATSGATESGEID